MPKIYNLNKLQRSPFDKLYLTNLSYLSMITAGNLYHLVYIVRSSSEGTSERLTPYTSLVD